MIALRSTWRISCCNNNSPVIPNEQQLFEQYQADQLKLMEEHNNTMIDTMNALVEHQSSMEV